MVLNKTLWSGVLPTEATLLYVVNSGKRSTINLWKMFSQAAIDTNLNLYATISGNNIPFAKIVFKPGYSLDVLDENQELKLAAGDSISGFCNIENGVNGVIQGTEEFPV